MSAMSKNNFFLIAVVLAATFSVTSFAETKGVAYVSNQEGAVTVIDLETMQPKGTLDIAAKGPRGIGITADGKWLVTANKDDSNISVVNTSTGKLDKQIFIGKNPEFVRVVGNMAYVTFEPSMPAGAGTQPAPKVITKDDDDKVPGHVAIVDLIAGKIIVDIVGKPETEGVELTKDGRNLIVTNESDNSISVHEVSSGKLLKNISLAKFGDRPRGIKASPDGSIYVSTLELSNKMLVFNDKFELIKDVATGKTPYGVSFDKEGKRVFVAANKEKMLQVFSTKTWEKIKDIPTGDRCWHFTFTPDNQQILLVCGRSNDIVVIDADRLEVTKRITNSGLPWGIVTYPKSMGSLDQP